MDRKLCSLIAPILALLVASTSMFAQPSDQQKRASELWKQGVGNFQAARYDAAITNFNDYVNLRPDAAAGWYNRGISYFERSSNNPRESDYRQAVADLSQAIKLDPRKPDHWYMRGRANQKLIVIDFKKSSEAAILDYTETIRLEPKNADAFSGRGQVHYEIGQYDKAIIDLNEAIRLKPNDAVPYYYRGKIYGYQKMYAASRADVEKALSIYPNYEVAKIYLDYITKEARKGQPSAPVTKATPQQPTVPVIKSNAAPNRPDEGFKLAHDAEKRRDHRAVIDIVTKTLPLIKMSAKGEPEDTFMTSVYLELLRKRARAYLSLKQFPNADKDFENAAMDAMANMNRHGNRSNEELRKDKTGMGAGLIMGALENSYAVIICDSSFASVSEWLAAIDRDRPDQMDAKMRSAMVMGATRQVCAAHYTTKGSFDQGRTFGSSTDRTKGLNAAIESYTKAITYMQVFREAYVHRAKAYRAVGKVDLALADEQKAASLAKK